LVTARPAAVEEVIPDAWVPVEAQVVKIKDRIRVYPEIIFFHYRAFCLKNE
jgi:hypothetical protein